MKDEVAPPVVDAPPSVHTPPTVDSPSAVDAPSTKDSPRSVDDPPTMDSPRSVDDLPTVDSPCSVDDSPTLDSPCSVDDPPTVDAQPTVDALDTPSTLDFLPPLAVENMKMAISSWKVNSWTESHPLTGHTVISLKTLTVQCCVYLGGEKVDFGKEMND